MGDRIPNARIPEAKISEIGHLEFLHSLRTFREQEQQYGGILSFDERDPYGVFAGVNRIIQRKMRSIEGTLMDIYGKGEGRNKEFYICKIGGEGVVEINKGNFLKRVKEVSGVAVGNADLINGKCVGSDGLKTSPMEIQEAEEILKSEREKIINRIVDLQNDLSGENLSGANMIYGFEVIENKKVHIGKDVQDLEKVFKVSDEAELKANNFGEGDIVFKSVNPNPLVLGSLGDQGQMYTTKLQA